MKALVTPALILLLTLSAVAASHADPMVLRLTPESQTLEVGESGSVSLMLDNPISVRSASITLSGDPALISDMVFSPGAIFDDVPCSLWEEYEEEAPGVWTGFVVIMGASCETMGPGEVVRWDFSALAEGVTQLLTLEVRMFDGPGDEYSELEVQAPAEILIGELSPAPPSRTDLHLMAHPNPFNPQTTISFELPSAQAVQMHILDIAGNRVRQLGMWPELQAGRHEVVWDGRSDSGLMQASGLYFYRIEAGPYSQVRKLTLMK